jgi:hypothetical protein
LPVVLGLVRAQFDYAGGLAPQLSFSKGDEMRILAPDGRDKGGWLEVENRRGERGIVALSFVERL